MHQSAQPMTPRDGSLQSDDPVLSVVSVNGEPIWQVCGGGYCVRSRSGPQALDLLRALLLSRGVRPPVS